MQACTKHLQCILFTLLIGLNIVAYEDLQTLPHPTVRHSRCNLLLSPGARSRCQQCTSHRQSLNILIKRLYDRPSTVTDPLSHANYRYLSTQEKDERLRHLHRLCRLKERRISRLQHKLASSIEQCGVNLDYHHDDFYTILKEESRSLFNFRRNHFNESFGSNS